MIGGVLLAAGAGTRFRAAGGGVKLLAPVDGRPLVEWALAALAAAPLGDRVIVLGAHADELLAAADLHGARAGAQRALGARHGVVAAGRAWRRSIRRARRRVVVLGDGPGAGGGGDPPRGRGGRGRRAARRGAPTTACAAAIPWRSRARSGRGCRRPASRARAALGEPRRPRRLQRPAAAGRRRHAGRSAARAYGPACASAACDRCAARARRRRCRRAP